MYDESGVCDVTDTCAQDWVTASHYEVSHTTPFAPFTFALTLSYMFKCYSTEYCYLWRPQFKQYILCLRFRRRGRTFNKYFLLRASSFRGCICITHRPLYILPINIFIHDNPSLTCWWLSNVLCKHDSQLVSLCYARYKYIRQNGHSCFAIECRRLIQFNNTICSFKSHGLSISF